MSLLDTASSTTPEPAALVADHLVQNLRNTYQYIVASFTENAVVFWRNPEATPSEIAAALGINGRELFELHWQLGQFIAAIKPEAVNAGLSVVGEFSYTEDGRVVVVDPPEEETEPPAEESEP